jgi:hypothetical protein
VIKSYTENVRLGNYTADVHLSLTAHELIAEEKWVAVDTRKYSGNDPEITGKTLFANPSVCHSFLVNGQITVSEYIRHHNTLAANGLWPWTDEDFEMALQITVGKVYFHHMGNLDLANLQDLVKTSSTRKWKYLDYPTECKLRKLVDKEHRDGMEGLQGRADLRNHREFYQAWGEMLFGDIVIEMPRIDIHNNTSEGVVKTSTSPAFGRDQGMSWTLCAILVYLAIYC